MLVIDGASRDATLKKIVEVSDSESKRDPLILRTGQRAFYDAMNKAFGLLEGRTPAVGLNFRRHVFHDREVLSDIARRHGGEATHRIMATI